MTVRAVTLLVVAFLALIGGFFHIGRTQGRAEMKEQMRECGR
jgi:hypothetical protein